jgi:hypothetical protein
VIWPRLLCNCVLYRLDPGNNPYLSRRMCQLTGCPLLLRKVDIVGLAGPGWRRTPAFADAVLARMKSVCIVWTQVRISVNGALSRRLASAFGVDCMLPTLHRDVIVRGSG